MDAHAAEGSDLPELLAEDFASRLVEEAFTVHDAGDAVIDGIARIHRDLDSGFTHATQEIRSTIISNLCSYFQPVPVTDYDTDSFGRDDLPLVAKLADHAHTFIFEQLAKLKAEQGE
ncbi:MAG: hypothetical protein BWX86_01468 [Verrucomicrobia bacterium ADurb.Bin122]|nr:MAG: hypothetical protein BWX86_01468 [Verrucomicrobia bacterium ADurb.Bin122]